MSMELSITLMVGRLLWYSSMTFAWETFIVEWTHGVVFGLAWAAGTSYCRSIAPEGMGATMQGFYTAWMWGIGTGTGCLVGGTVAANWGVPAVFGVFGWDACCCC